MSDCDVIIEQNTAYTGSNHSFFRIFMLWKLLVPLSLSMYLELVLMNITVKSQMAVIKGLILVL